MSLKSLGSSIGDLEYGEAEFARWVAEAMPEQGREGWFVRVANEIVRRQARAAGVAVEGLLFGDGERVDAPALERAAGEPHALGWLHQHVGAPKRRESQAAHHHHEAKHPAQATTTQLYTPRWVADILVERSIRARATDEPATWFDPAVGGGQMLLAAVDAQHRHYPGRDPGDVAGSVGGCDIDPRAVRVARTSLKLRLAEMFGRRDSRAEALIDRQVQCADGLTEDPPELKPSGRPDIVITNPPYMGSRSMPEDLKRRLRDEARPYHRDLYAAFIDRCHVLSDDVVAILAQQTIWYLKRFEAARADLLERGALLDFVHLGTGVFRTLSGEKANVVAFVQTTNVADASRAQSPATDFVDLRDLTGAEAKRLGYLQLQRSNMDGTDPQKSATRRRLKVEVFSDIPGRPMAHGCPAPLREMFGKRRLGDVADIPGSQNKTGDNGRYVRPWTEVDESELHTGPMEAAPAMDADRDVRDPAGARWYFYSKGGRYAPWWGNWDSVVDWSDEATDFYRTNGTSNLLASEYRFREGLCYTDFGGADFNARWMPPGCLFDMAGPAIFPRPEWLEAGMQPRSRLFALLALLNSSPVRRLLNAMNPSLHYQVGDLRELPIPEWDGETELQMANAAVELVRGYRMLAAAVESSPVGEVASVDQPASGPSLAGLQRIEAELDSAVCELYEWAPQSIRAPRGHRYA
jgi:hypothetical protein